MSISSFFLLGTLLLLFTGLSEGEEIEQARFTLNDLIKHSNNDAAAGAEAGREQR